MKDAIFGVDMAKVMMGEDAFQVAFNLISQACDDGEKVAGVFQTSHGLPLLAGSQRTHILMLGDMIFRPRLIVATDAFRGAGLSHLAKEGFISAEEWAKGDVILKRE